MNNIRLKLISSLLVLFLLGCTYWAFNTSFITINVNGSATPYTYLFYNQSTRKTATVKSDSPNIKKRLSSGNYEILIKHGNTSYFTVAKTGRFFSSLSVEAKLTSENLREFVGDNPGQCMKYIGGRLISYDCNAAYSDLRIHIPASKDVPTYVLTNSKTDIQGYVNGIVSTSNGEYVLVFSTGSLEAKPGYYLYKIRADLSWSEKTSLPQLDSSKSYSIKPFNQGFLIYDSGFNNFYYYASAKSKPVTIDIGAPRGKDYKPASVDISTDSILAAYSGKSSTEILVWNNTTTSYTVSDMANKVVFCGNQMICAVSNQGIMSVYKVIGSKLRGQYRVYDVKDVFNSGNGFLVARDDDVLSLDTANRSGYESYSLNEYKFNNIDFENGYYVLSLTNNKGRKVAIRVGQTLSDSDSIDKKILGIQKLSEVQAVSIYKNDIFITPELGPAHFDASVGYYRPDSAVERSATTIINNEVVKLGINRNIYSVVITH